MKAICNYSTVQTSTLNWLETTAIAKWNCCQCLERHLYYSTGSCLDWTQLLLYVLLSQLVFVAASVPRELPATVSRALTMLTPAMRRRIYEYCVEVARSTNTSSRIADEDLTLLEDTRCNKFHFFILKWWFAYFVLVALCGNNFPAVFFFNVGSSCVHG